LLRFNLFIKKLFKVIKLNKYLKKNNFKKYIKYNIVFNRNIIN